MLFYFEYEHLPDYLHPAMKLYYDTAIELQREIRNLSQLEVTLRKLLESRDEAYRSIEAEYRAAQLRSLVQQ